MPSFKDADLAAIKARYESNYALITRDHPKIANDPVIIAALAKKLKPVRPRFTPRSKT